MIAQPSHEIIGHSMRLAWADDIGKTKDCGVDAKHVSVCGKERLAAELARTVRGHRDQGAEILVDLLEPAVSIHAGARGVRDSGHTANPSSLNHIVCEVGALPEVYRRVIDGRRYVGGSSEEVHMPNSSHRLDNSIEVLKISLDQAHPGVVE